MKTPAISLILSFLLTPLNGYALDTREVQRIIADNNITTIEGLLETQEIKTALPQMTVNLVYESRSSQSASFEFPRTILSNDIHRSTDNPQSVFRSFFAMSFNGEKTQKGFYNLEIIEFNSDKGRFEFHELIFDPMGRRAPTPVLNATRCLMCHQDRPVWDSYPHWPGVYGSIATEFGEPDKNELKEFEKFYNQRDGTRYKNLPISPNLYDRSFANLSLHNAIRFYNYNRIVTLLNNDLFDKSWVQKIYASYFCAISRGPINVQNGSNVSSEFTALGSMSSFGVSDQELDSLEKKYLSSGREKTDQAEIDDACTKDFSKQYCEELFSDFPLHKNKFTDRHTRKITANFLKKLLLANLKYEKALELRATKENLATPKNLLSLLQSQYQSTQPRLSYLDRYLMRRVSNYGMIPALFIAREVLGINTRYWDTSFGGGTNAFETGSASTDLTAMLYAILSNGSGIVSDEQYLRVDPILYNSSSFWLYPMCKVATEN